MVATGAGVLRLMNIDEDDSGHLDLSTIRLDPRGAARATPGQPFVRVGAAMKYRPVIRPPHPIGG